MMEENDKLKDDNSKLKSELDKLKISSSLSQTKTKDDLF
jgi:regulator of replication initiation timing